MEDEHEKDEPKVKAEDQSIAIDAFNIDGDVHGNITIGHTIGLTAEQVSFLLKDITTTFQPKPFDGRSPYKGLAAFQEKDARLFFGREQIVEDLLSRVQPSRAVFITGPSGSGKSSLIRAGLIPALKKGAIQDSDEWIYETMVPGREPMFELARVASSLAGTLNAGEDIRTKGLNDETILLQWCEVALQDGREKRAVIFIDQFEEVFTQRIKEADRAAFLKLLTYAAIADPGRVILLLAMRSDFVANCATYPQLNALLNRQFVQIGAMHPKELVSAIAQPALRVGLQIDPDLIAQVIADMKGEPGALPLMQFTLKDLFDVQQSKGGLIVLRLEDYLRHGGIQKSLERHADGAFAELETNEQELARSIFSGLIELGRGIQPTRRTALFAELIPANATAENVRATVQRLADARLITTDEKDDKYTVTLAHEKLIDAWPWLQKLVNENRDVIALQNEIAADAKDWADHAYDESYLYTGARLANAREQLEAKKLILGGLAQSFIEAGVKVHADELEASRQKAAQLRRRSLYLSVALVVALMAVGVAIFFSIQSREQARIALARQLVAQAQNALDTDPALSALLSVESIRRFPAILGRQSLYNALTALGSAPTEVFIPFGAEKDRLYNLAISQDGRWLAAEVGVQPTDHSLRLWDLQSPTTAPQIISGPGAQFIGLSKFSPDGTWLANLGNNTTSPDNTFLQLWNIASIDVGPRVITDSESGIKLLEFSPDENWLATLSNRGILKLYDLRSPDSEPLIPPGQKHGILSFAFSQDGHWIVGNMVNLDVQETDPPSGSVSAGGTPYGSIQVWNMESIESEPRPLDGKINLNSPLSISGDGRWIAGVGIDGALKVWDVQMPNTEPRFLTTATALIRSLMFGVDGRWLAVTNMTGFLELWDLTTNEPESISLHRVELSSEVFSPDHRWIAIASKDTDGSYVVRLWDMQIPLAPPRVLGHSASILGLPAFSPNGHWLVINGQFGTLQRWDLRSFTEEPRVLNNPGAVSDVVISPTGDWLAGLATDSTVWLWDMTHLGNEPFPLSGLRPLEGGVEYSYTLNPFVFSPDGAFLAGGSGDSSIRLWDMRSPKSEPRVIQGAKGDIASLAFSPDGVWLASRTLNGVLQMWDMLSPTLAAYPLNGQQGYFSTSLFSHDANWLAARNDDGTVWLWNIDGLEAGPRILKAKTGSVGYNLRFSPDNEQLFNVTDDGTLNVWELTLFTAQQFRLAHLDTGFGTQDHLVFSQDGRWLAVLKNPTKILNKNEAIRLWDMTNPTVGPVNLQSVFLYGPYDSIDDVGFSSDGRWLASSNPYPSSSSSTSNPHVVQIWDLQSITEEPLVLSSQQGNILGFGGLVEKLIFSKDNRLFIRTSDDNTIKVWNLDQDLLIRNACQIARRNFTHVEWTQYFPDLSYPTNQKDATCPEWPLEAEPIPTLSPTP